MDDTSSDTDLSSSPESFQSCPDDMDQTSTAHVIVAAPNPVELLSLGHPVGGFTDSTRKPAGGATGGTFSAVWGLVSGSASPPGKCREGTQYPVGGLKKDTASPGDGWASDSLSPIARLRVSSPSPVGGVKQSTLSPVGGLRQSAPSLVRRLREDSPCPVSGMSSDMPSANSGMRESPFRMRERTPSPDSELKEIPFRMRERTPSPDLELKEIPFRMREHTPSPDLGWKESPFRMRERTPSPDLELKESPFRMREHTPSPDLGWKESAFRMRECTPSLDPGLRESPFRMRERTPSPDSGSRDFQGLREHTPSPVVGTPAACVVKASPGVQEREKTLGVATKRLGVVRDKLKYFLKETTARGRSVQQKLDKVESNKTEVEKALNDHVKYLHSLLDYYHHEQQELLKQHHKGFLKQLMVTKTEELNFEAKLTDMQKKVDDVFHRIVKERDAKAANSRHIANLCDEYHRCVSSRPGRKDHSQTYLVEIPQVTVDDMQALVGHYVFTDGSDNIKASPSYPTPHWPGYEDLPADQAARAERGSSSSSSQKSAASLKTGNSAKSVPPKASTVGKDTKDYSLPKTPSGDATQDHKTTGNPPTSSLRFSKERRMKEKLAKASSSNVSSSEESCTQPSQPSAQPRAISASLDKKQKQSEMMASTSSIASSASVSSKKKARKRRQKKKAEAKQETAEPAKPTMITLLHEKGQPKKIDGRLKEARGFAAKPDGELWVVYGSRDPHLDRINEAGDVLESCRIGGNAMQAASFSQESVLLCLHSPCCQLKLLDAQRESQDMVKLPLIPSGLGVGSTGIAVCGYQAVYWVPLDGGANEWIVEQKKSSSLKNACSCDVIFMQGKEIVCVADSEGHKVWFFEKLDSGKFTPLPLFTYASLSKQGKTVPFSPVCLSWLAGSSFLAVLDGASHSVLMVDVERNEVVSVVSGKELCDGVPSLICFALTNAGENPKLWVASDSKKIYLVSLAFLY